MKHLNFRYLNSDFMNNIFIIKSQNIAKPFENFIAKNVQGVTKNIDNTTRL